MSVETAMEEAQEPQTPHREKPMIKRMTSLERDMLYKDTISATNHGKGKLIDFDEFKKGFDV
ncbi:MAG: hypothetical protein WD492_02855 [Alkalispirochaeta sp.]